MEGLEALRLLSSATQAHALADVAAERDLLAEPLPLGDESAGARRVDGDLG